MPKYFSKQQKKRCRTLAFSLAASANITVIKALLVSSQLPAGSVTATMRAPANKRVDITARETAGSEVR